MIEENNELGYNKVRKKAGECHVLFGYEYTDDKLSNECKQ